MYSALAQATKPRCHNTKDLINEYLMRGMADLSASTQAGYHRKKKNLLLVFGSTDPDSIEPGHIAQYLEARKQQNSPVAGNREICLLSSVFNYGMRQGYCKTNPCKVRRNTERPGKRYIPHDEFLAAFNRCAPEGQDLLALAYLTGLRQKDLRTLKKAQITPDGIVVDESKTGKRRIIGWSESLRYFLLRATSRTPDSEYVLTNTKGQPWGEWAVQSLMRRLKTDFTFHQIRHKAETDHREGMGLLPLYRRVTRHGPTR